MKTDQILMPIPLNLKKEDIALLIESRQKILVKLFEEERTLLRLIESLKKSSNESGSVLNLINPLIERDLVEKTPNKIYKLTKKGRLLTLILLKPNGKTEGQLRELFQRFLEEEYHLPSGEANSLVEYCREVPELAG